MRSGVVWLAVAACTSDPPCGAGARVCERFETGSWTQLGYLAQTGEATAAIDGTRTRSGDAALHLTLAPAAGSRAVLFAPSFDHPVGVVRLTADAFVYLDALPATPIAVMTTAGAGILVEPGGAIVQRGTQADDQDTGLVFPAGRWVEIDWEITESAGTVSSVLVLDGQRGGVYTPALPAAGLAIGLAAVDTPASAAPVEAWVDDVYLGWDIAP